MRQSLLSRFSKRLTLISTGKIAVIALVIFLLFTMLVLPDQAARAEQAAGTAESPDTSFFYSAQDLYRIAEEYGEQGRSAYIRARFTFDIIWPVVYSVFLLTAAGWLGSRLFSESRWSLLNLVPLLGTLFDFLENVGASLVFARFPDTSPILGMLTPVFTLLKWVFLSVGFLIIIFEAAAVLWRKLSKSI
ncbi:MAG: hypothetical protein JXA25_15940 [Anaerolineales bacterium]|nr:hypothetical protein [Anaerolineales bacterium]